MYIFCHGKFVGEDKTVVCLCFNKIFLVLWWQKGLGACQTKMVLWLKSSKMVWHLLYEHSVRKRYLITFISSNFRNIFLLYIILWCIYNRMLWSCTLHLHVHSSYFIIQIFAPQYQLILWWEGRGGAIPQNPCLKIIFHKSVWSQTYWWGILQFHPKLLWVTVFLFYIFHWRV